MRNRIVRDDRGGALVLVLVISVLLLSVSSVIVSRTGSEARAADLAGEYEAALHAAEAGLNDYIAKTTEDHLYYNHYVHPAEDTRLRSAGGTVTAGNTWPGDPTWTYPTRLGQWRRLGDASLSQYEYNLIVTPPTAAFPAMTITATGRRRSNPRYVRSVEAQVQGTSVAEFQLISNQTFTVAAATTTNGKYYSTQSINFNGVANANVMAEGTVTGTGTINPPSKACDSVSTTCPIRSVIKNPIVFNTFSGSLAEVQRASQSVSGGGIYLPTTSGMDGWRMTLNAAGTITIEKCTKSGSSNLAAVAPTCVAYQTKDVPTVGAIYADQSIIVRGTLHGRVTIVSNQDIIVDDDIDYVDGSVDVLGLIAKNNIYMAQYSPHDLTWRGAVIAQTGAVKLWDCAGTPQKGTMTFTGSRATNLAPCTNSTSGGGFAARVYNYDTNLLFLQPPFFPVLEEAYSILRYREVTV